MWKRKHWPAAKKQGCFLAFWSSKSKKRCYLLLWYQRKDGRSKLSHSYTGASSDIKLLVRELFRVISLTVFYILGNDDFSSGNLYVYFHCMVLSIFCRNWDSTTTAIPVLTNFCFSYLSEVVRASSLRAVSSLGHFLINWCSNLCWHGGEILWSPEWSRLWTTEMLGQPKWNS